MMNRTRLSFALSCCLLAAVAVGCNRGPKPLPFTTAAVTGTVTFEGKPLVKGLIRFIPDTAIVEGQVAGKPISAKIEDGKYSIPAEKGATVGKNRVEVISYRGTGVMEQTSAGTKEEKTEQFIPEQYNATSTLSVEITEGANEHNFDL